MGSGTTDEKATQSLVGREQVANWIRRVRQGDQDAFVSLAKQYEPDNTLRHILHDLKHKQARMQS